MATRTFKGVLRAMARNGNFSRFVIDEAHCISEWGHDFRSAYLSLGDVRQEHAGIPIMALTATATARVQSEIISILGLRKNAAVFKSDFDRPNLCYSVRYKDLLDSPLEDLAVLINESTISFAFSIMR